MALIYLAHPIDNADSSIHAWVSRCVDLLDHESGISVYRPARAWLINPTLDGRVQTVNMLALYECDVVLAYCPAGALTRGVPYEIAAANERGIPVVLVTENDPQSMMTAYWTQHPNVSVYTPDELSTAINHASLIANAPRKDKWNVAHWTGGDGQLQQAHVGDAGFDLAYNGDDDMGIRAGDRRAVPTGVRVEMPAGYYSLIVGRSSSFSKRNLLVPLSVIDAGFRGELFAVCWNYGKEDQLIHPNERVAQLLPMKLEASGLRWQKVLSLSDSERAENGFGSSGR